MTRVPSNYLIPVNPLTDKLAVRPILGYEIGEFMSYSLHSSSLAFYLGLAYMNVSNIYIITKNTRMHFRA